MTIHFEMIETNGIRLHVALAGPEDGEPVFLLHGFPEAWFGWEAQIIALAAQGFRVIAPDQRGYNLSDKPAGVASYRMDLLVLDIVGLADALGVAQFNLAGHDFGAMVSWILAMRHPDRIKKLVIANVPHPQVMISYLRSHVSQMRRSWYAMFFQLPRLPEASMKANQWQAMIKAMPAYFSAQQRDRYRKAWSQPNAITTMINWYRAVVRHSPKLPDDGTVSVPTLIVWGRQDPHLSYEMAPLSLARCDNGRLVTLDEATHWVLWDCPDEVTQLMSDHFSS